MPPGGDNVSSPSQTATSRAAGTGHDRFSLSACRFAVSRNSSRSAFPERWVGWQDTPAVPPASVYVLGAVARKPPADVSPDPRDDYA